MSSTCGFYEATKDNIDAGANDHVFASDMIRTVFKVQMVVVKTSLS